MSSGIDAFNNARFPEAVQSFEHAVQLDPKSTDALEALAVAYLGPYNPPGNSIESPFRKNAEETFLKSCGNRSLG